MPGIAFAPVALLLFGFSLQMELMVIILPALWPVLINTMGAVMGVHARLFEVGRTFRLSQGEILRKIMLPAALPGVLVGARLRMTLALGRAMRGAAGGGRRLVPGRVRTVARGRLMDGEPKTRGVAGLLRSVLASLPPARGLLPLILLLLVWQLLQPGPSPYFPGPSQWWTATLTLFGREHLVAAFGATTWTF